MKVEYRITHYGREVQIQALNVESLDDVVRIEDDIKVEWSNYYVFEGTDVIAVTLYMSSHFEVVTESRLTGVRGSIYSVSKKEVIG